MIYIGIDPSYTKTGVSYIDLADKFILLNAVTPEGTNESYIDMIKRARLISTDIFSKLDRDNIVIMEEPLIVSQKASSLGILSGVLATELLNNIMIDEVYTLHPNAVSNTNRGQKDYSSKNRKNVSRRVALEYIEVFKSFGYKVVIYNDKTNKDGSMKKRVLSTDESEAFIMTLMLMRHLNVLDKEIEEQVLIINRGLNSDHTINQLKPIKESEK